MKTYSCADIGCFFFVAFQLYRNLLVPYQSSSLSAFYNLHWCVDTHQPTIYVDCPYFSFSFNRKHDRRYKRLHIPFFRYHPTIQEVFNCHIPCLPPFISNTMFQFPRNPVHVVQDNSYTCRTACYSYLVALAKSLLPYTSDSDTFLKQSKDKYRYTRRLSKHSCGTDISSHFNSFRIRTYCSFMFHIFPFVISYVFRFQFVSVIWIVVHYKKTVSFVVEEKQFSSPHRFCLSFAMSERL